tara:strand:- start:4208 stop:5689 length:1482 start_codon:yes stop_codon:yes gene_type:complete
MSNCIWRIHEFDRRDDAVNVLEFVDEDTNTYNCSKTEWFNDTITKIDRKDTYTCDGIRGIVKYPNYQENIQDIFDQCDKDPDWKKKKLFKFQDDYSNDDDDDSKLSFDDIQAITILIESYDDGDSLNNRCVSGGYIDSDERSLCYKRNSNEETKRFNDFIKMKTKTSKEITIEDVRNNTIELLNKLTNKRLFDIYQGIPNSDYTYNDEYEEDNKAFQDKLKNKLQAIREAYRSKDHILPEEIQLHLDDNVDINKGIEFNITDLQGSSLYPKMYKSLLNQLKTNRKFRQCIDEKLDIKNIHGYNEFMNDVKKDNFKIGKYIDFIKSACDEFISLPPDKIKECIDKLNYSEVLKNNICEGDITLTMIDSYHLVLEFIGINIIINELDEGTIIRLTPLIKEVFHKVITTSEYYEQTLCKGKTSKITQNLKTMYNTLFDTRKSIEYPFKNHIKWKWFKPFDNIFGKVILLIFICFIFAKIVDLFSGKDCCPQVPVNK